MDLLLLETLQRHTVSKEQHISPFLAKRYQFLLYFFTLGAPCGLHEQMELMACTRVGGVFLRVHRAMHVCVVMLAPLVACLKSRREHESTSVSSFLLGRGHRRDSGHGPA